MRFKNYITFAFFMLVIVPILILTLGGNDGLTLGYILNDYYIPVNEWLKVFPVY